MKLKMLPWLKGGEGDGWSIFFGDTLDTLSNALSIILYSRIFPSAKAQRFVKTRLSAKSSEELIYGSNESFWKDALFDKHFPGARIILNSFILTEWIPFTPGRYHTAEASNERYAAQIYRSPKSATEYTPEGKGLMMRGGAWHSKVT
jgi:hypothetical protein